MLLLTDGLERSLRIDTQEGKGLLQRSVHIAAEVLVADAQLAVHGDLAEPVAIGVSSVCQGEAAFAAGFAEAQHALVGTAVLSGKPAVLAYDDLGAYKYLLRVAVDGGIRDATVDAVGKLAEYDAQRGAQLLATLEEFLRRHGSISATSEALYVHPNTLRQRLRRIAELSGLDLRRDDWLAIEIAVKMVKLQQALGAAKPHT